MAVKFSIIIPVYNVKKYLSECINSVLSQTYDDYEIILVDDGSTDGSSKLCDEYQNQDSRIKTIHKENGGLSSARNCGIQLAKGVYILFLDSDDFWNDKNALSTIAEMTNRNVDLVCFGYREYVDGQGDNGVGIDFYEFDLQLTDKDAVLKEMISKGVYVSSAWCKAVKRSVIIDNKLMFVEGITSEDVDWSARLLKCINNVAVFPESFYCYRQRNSSIVHNIKYENVEILTDNIIRCVELGKDIPEGRTKALYYNYVSYQFITFLKLTLLCEDDSRNIKLRKKMKHYQWLLKYHLNKKVKMVYLANKIFGYNMIFRLLKIYS